MTDDDLFAEPAREVARDTARRGLAAARATLGVAPPAIPARPARPLTAADMRPEPAEDAEDAEDDRP